MSKLNISQAAKAVGKSRPIIYKKIKNGELSIEEGAEGEKLIDTSELIRVFGELVTPGTVSNDVNDLQDNTPADPAGLHQKIHYLEMENERLREEIERERKEKSTLLDDLRLDRDEWRKQAQTLLLTAAKDDTEKQRGGFWNRIFRGKVA